MRGEIFRHFKSQFSAPFKSRPSMPAEFGQRRIQAADNELLSCPFKKDEIQKAIWDCEPSKSPGPDGFSFDFIKRY